MLITFVKLLALYLGTSPVCAQTVGATQLLTRGPGAEAAALAGGMVSIVHDPTALYWNPAGLASAGGMVSGEHLFLYDGARYDFLGLSVPSGLGTFGLGALQLDRGGIIARSAIDDPGSTVSNTQSIYLLGLGRALNEHWSVGSTLNVLDFNLAGYKDKGWGLDAGVQGAYPQEEFWGLKRLVWSFGAAVRNLIEPKITLMSDTEAFPRELRGGVGLSFQAASRASASGVVAHDRALVLLSARKVSGDGALNPGLGFAYDYQNLLVFRLGFDGDLSAGVGFHTPDGKFILDYAMENKPLALNHRFTLSYRFLAPKTKPRETYAEEIDDGYAQAKSQAEALAHDNVATGEKHFKDQEYHEALAAFNLATLLSPDDKGIALAYRRAQEAFRRQEIHRLSTDATLDPATGQEEQAYLDLAKLLDLGADGRETLQRRLANIALRIPEEQRLRLSRQVVDRRLDAARRLVALGAISEARQLEDTAAVFASSEAAAGLAQLREETSAKEAALRKAFAAASSEDWPGMTLARTALALRRALPDDGPLAETVTAALARYRAAYPLSMKERFYLRKLYYLAALRRARNVGDDAIESRTYLAEIQRRDPADEDADTLLDAMALEGLAHE
jgi:hypothetical protein